MSGEGPTVTTVLFGSFELFLETGELRKDGLRLKLSGQPIQVLACLVATPGKLVTREELQQQLWPGNTYGDFEKGLNAAVTRLREHLNDSATEPRYIETIPGRGYRFIANVRVSNNGEEGAVVQNRPNWKILVPMAVVLIAALLAGVLYYRSRLTKRITDKDTILLADFDNRTGDAVFDDTLRLGLRAQLEQSPFLNLLSDQQINGELRLMGRQPGERLTVNLALDLCQRVGSKAVLTSSISTLGTHYVISLNAVDCHTGSQLASDQSEASDKEHVLAALASSATQIRKKLGESHASIQKYDVPIEQVTTSSLEALQAYSLGMKYLTVGDFRRSLPHFQQAVELDPNFASAYMQVAHATLHLVDGDPRIVKENVEKAYSLRDRVSRREYFSITVRYFDFWDDMEKVQSVDELWAETYPRDAEPHFQLADIAMTRGNWEEAVKQGRIAVDANPNDVRYSYDLAVSQLALDRLDAGARRTCIPVSATMSALRLLLPTHIGRS